MRMIVWGFWDFFFFWLLTDFFLILLRLFPNVLVHWNWYEALRCWRVYTSDEDQILKSLWTNHTLGTIRQSIHFHLFSEKPFHCFYPFSLQIWMIFIHTMISLLEYRLYFFLKINHNIKKLWQLNPGFSSWPFSWYDTFPSSKFKQNIVQFFNWINLINILIKLYSSSIYFQTKHKL